MKLIDLLVKELPKHGGWPEGAVECERFLNEATIDFYDESGNWPVDCGEKYGPIAVKCLKPREAGDGYRKENVKKEEYEAALAASKPSEWDGEGVPEKGDLCIYRDKDEGPIETVVIASCDDGGDVVIWHKPTRGRDYSVDSLCFFEAAVNEEGNKRIRVAQAMCDLLGNGITVDEKEGYGKFWLDAYDAIAAGKIPGIRLIDDAGN